jgi:hypothetical protein
MPYPIEDVWVFATLGVYVLVTVVNLSQRLRCPIFE